MEETPQLETEAGLNYLREQRERMTDQELIELYKTIKEIEHDAKEPWHKGYRFRLADWRTHAKVPFDTLPCHRAIMIELQGEQWVLERERSHGDDLRANEIRLEAERQAALKLREAKAKALRNL